MLLAGDEFGQTQHGNNNAYCQNNELSWLDWTLPETETGRSLRDFVAHLIALRKEHPLLREPDFHAGDKNVAEGINRVFWFDEHGSELQQHDWENCTARLLGLRRARSDGNHVELLLILANADTADHRFALPTPHFSYRILTDTNDPARRDSELPDGHCDVAAHSLLLLYAKVARSDVPRSDQPPREDVDTNAQELPAETMAGDAA
jgi:glycogen operon protein